MHRLVVSQLLSVHRQLCLDIQFEVEEWQQDLLAI
jgi:hypothetical protein